MCERAAAQTRSCKQMHEYRRTRRHDLTVYCSRFYGRPISLLLPFVLRIISLHGMGGFELSHFLFIPCMSPIFTFPFHLDGISFVSFFVFFFFLLHRLEVSLRSRQYRQVVQNPWGTFAASLLSFHCVLPLSAPSLSLSVLPGCLARRTVLDLLVLSALCIWMVLCARLGLRPECAHQSVFCQSAWKCNHSPVHESETNLASPP